MSPDLPKPGSCHGSDDDDDCPSPPSSDGNRHLVTPLVVTAFVLVFLSLVSLSIYCFIRRRRRQRRQQSLLAAGAANPAAQGDGPAPEMAGAATATDVQGGAAPDPEDEEVVHHAWHIRTVGLDEAAIESIALTRYRVGAGTLGGAADCSVCLGEFLDGELLRLLPKCGHAFHVPCIGTWLRAHVNCPLCRADVVVLDSAATGGSEPPADAQQVSETLSQEQPVPAQGQNEQQELRVQIDRRCRSRSPEPQRRRTENFRRVASMDSSVVSVGAGLVLEDKRSSTEDQGDGEVPWGSGRLRYLSGGGRRSRLSGHRRISSSMLPS
ncbi:E3 ubiquitin-protein ligase RING1-like [Triticum dicoccoides]|uniref:E3 ubiquitin-protein ligase RING1-like n=1 Tax=Triticum dicoccoides TaxID=85692 RepID=UPI001890F6DF|nr:E3 ubiquitin-protein ligase RING1-like [Triticum dicoccoides]